MSYPSRHVYSNGLEMTHMRGSNKKWTDTIIEPSESAPWSSSSLKRWVEIRDCFEKNMGKYQHKLED